MRTSSLHEAANELLQHARAVQSVNPKRSLPRTGSDFVTPRRTYDNCQAAQAWPRPREGGRDKEACAIACRCWPRNGLCHATECASSVGASLLLLQVPCPAARGSLREPRFAGLSRWMNAGSLQAAKTTSVKMFRLCVTWMLLAVEWLAAVRL